MVFKFGDSSDSEEERHDRFRSERTHRDGKVDLRALNSSLEVDSRSRRSRNCSVCNERTCICKSHRETRKYTPPASRNRFLERETTRKRRSAEDYRGSERKSKERDRWERQTDYSKYVSERSSPRTHREDIETQSRDSEKKCKKKLRKERRKEEERRRKHGEKLRVSEELETRLRDDRADKSDRLSDSSSGQSNHNFELDKQNKETDAKISLDKVHEKSHKHHKSHHRHKERMGKDESRVVESHDIPCSSSVKSGEMKNSLCSPEVSNLSEGKPPLSLSKVENILSEDDSGVSLPKKPLNDDLYGPCLPDKSSTDNIYGPCLPLKLESTSDELMEPCKEVSPVLSSNNDNTRASLPLKSVEEKSYGPVLPSDGGTQDQYGPGLPSKSSDENCDAYGPALPPKSHEPKHTENTSADEDESDSIGPLPEGSAVTPSQILLQHRANLLRLHAQNKPKKEEKKREEWMLELPDAHRSMLGSVVTARTFKTKVSDAVIDPTWTDSPAEKERKKALSQLEVSVKKPDVQKEITRQRDKEMEKIVKASKKSKEQKSLLELHQDKLNKEKKKKKKEGKKEERRPFNRETDLATNCLSQAQKNAIFKKARHLDSRFASGHAKYL